MCFQLCQRKGPLPGFDFVRVSEISLQCCAWSWKGWVGNSEQPSPFHRKNIVGSRQSCSQVLADSFAWCFGSQEVGISGNLGPLPNILNKCKALPGLNFQGSGCQKPICIFSLLYPNNSELSFLFTFGPRIPGKGGEAETNKKAIQPKLTNVKKVK